MPVLGKFTPTNRVSLWVQSAHGLQGRPIRARLLENDGTSAFEGTLQVTRGNFIRYCQIEAVIGKLGIRKAQNLDYCGYRFPPEIISYAVWLYHRFSLSFREVTCVQHTA
jgi:hypothetical protein